MGLLNTHWNLDLLTGRAVCAISTLGDRTLSFFPLIPCSATRRGEIDRAAVCADRPAYQRRAYGTLFSFPTTYPTG